MLSKPTNVHHKPMLLYCTHIYCTSCVLCLSVSLLFMFVLYVGFDFLFNFLLIYLFIYLTGFLRVNQSGSFIGWVSGQSSEKWAWLRLYCPVHRLLRDSHVVSSLKHGRLKISGGVVYHCFSTGRSSPICKCLLIAVFLKARFVSLQLICFFLWSRTVAGLSWQNAEPCFSLRVPLRHCSLRPPRSKWLNSNTHICNGE